MGGTTDDQHQLAIMLVADPLFRPFFPFFLIIATPDEVAAGVMGVKAGGVCGGVPDGSLAAVDSTHRVAQQPANAILFQQSSAGLVQRGVVRHRRQTDALRQLRAIDQPPPDATIVLLLEFLEHQAGEQLRLGELFGAVDVRVVAERFLAGSQRNHRHIPWRLTGNHLISNTKAGSRDRADLQATPTRGFLQSRRGPF